MSSSFFLFYSIICWTLDVREKNQHQFYFNFLCIEANWTIILHIFLGLQSALKNNLSALGVELVLEVLLDLLGSAQVDRKLGRLLLLRRLDRLGEDLQAKCEQDQNDRFAKLQLARNDNESWGKTDQGWVVRFLQLNSTWKALARAKVSLRAVCRESQTKARHSNGCRRVPPSPRSSGASFTTIIAKTLQERVSQWKPCLQNSTWCRRDLEPHS